MRPVIAVLICLAFSVVSVFSQTVAWQQEFHASCNGETLPFYSGGFSYAKPTFADIDADGDQDLFVGHHWDNGVVFFRNEGSSTAPEWRLETLNFFPGREVYTKPAFCDIDGDGDLDGFMGEWSGELHFFRNTGTPAEASWEADDALFAGIIHPDGHSMPTFCDMDADGDFDLFLGCNDERIIFFRNTGTASSPQFSAEDSSFAGGQVNGYACPCFYDIDHDGDQDLFVGSRQYIWFYRNSGTASNGNWVLESDHYGSLPVLLSYSAPVIADIDGDGDGDLIVGEDEYALRYFRNTGSPEAASWEEAASRYATLDVGYPCYPAFSDLDGDGDLDMLLGRYFYGIYFCENTGSPQSAAWQIDYDSYYIQDAHFPVFCDIDTDGDDDLFIGDSDGTVSLYENTGTAAAPVWANPISDYNSISVPGGYAHPAFVDIDADGDFDMYVGTGEGELWFYENTGTAQAAAWADPDTSICNLDARFISRVAPIFTDIDQDGDMDLFYGATSGEIAFWRNEGTPAVPSFVKVTDCYNSFEGEYQVNPVFADIDSDGDTDMFVGHYSGGLMFWRNMGFTDVDDAAKIPDSFELMSYPNPFNPATTIRYTVARPSYVRIDILNSRGRRVCTLVQGRKAAGSYTVVWKGADTAGSSVASGLYFCRLISGHRTAVHKMILLR